jgi:hypothetical protein
MGVSNGRVPFKKKHGATHSLFSALSSASVESWFWLVASVESWFWLVASVESWFWLVASVGELAPSARQKLMLVTMVKLNLLDCVWVACCDMKYLRHQQMHEEIGVNGLAVE